MIYLSMAFAWIVSFLSNVAAVFPTSAVIDGVCYGYMIWDSQTLRIVYYIGNTVLFYFLIILIFIVCYWRILIVLRRQVRVLASHDNEHPSTAQVKSRKIQRNVTKTTISVSALYAISWLPSYIMFSYITLDPNYTTHTGVYYASVITTYLYMCANPFIYAVKFDPVKRFLLHLIPCKKTPE